MSSILKENLPAPRKQVTQLTGNVRSQCFGVYGLLVFKSKLALCATRITVTGTETLLG